MSKKLIKKSPPDSTPDPILEDKLMRYWLIVKGTSTKVRLTKPLPMVIEMASQWKLRVFEIEQRKTGAPRCRPLLSPLQSEYHPYTNLGAVIRAHIKELEELRKKFDECRVTRQALNRTIRRLKNALELHHDRIEKGELNY